MDDIINDSSKVDNLEGQPISPEEMGIVETSIGGGESINHRDIRSELKEVFNPTFSTLGHGTRPEAAQQIIKQGLRAKQPDLNSTTVPLFDGSKPYEDQEPQVVEKISHWPHLDAKAVVIVMIPNPQEGEIGGSRYFNSVFQESPDPDNGYNDRYLIPPSYIKGYIDVEANKFIPNPKFQPEKPTVKANGIVSQVEDSKVPVDIPKASSPDNNTPDVW